jgi:GxxExxY protein
MNRQEAKNAKNLFPEPPSDFDAIARRVIGAAIEVHRHLGPGFLESVYDEALAIELGLLDIPFLRQHVISVGYKGCDVGEFRPDFFVENRLIVEVKAVVSLAPIHTFQVISYLKAADKPLGLLLNFKVDALKHGGIKRVVLSRYE